MNTISTRSSKSWVWLLTLGWNYAYSSFDLHELEMQRIQAQLLDYLASSYLQ